MEERKEERTWDSHSGGYQGFYLLQYNAAILQPTSLGFLLDVKGGGDMLHRNIGQLSTDYMALYPRR
jgi:hypothetical protein